MKSLFIVLMLLFGLLLCSCLGTREGLTNNISNTTVYSGPAGTATINNTDSSAQLITLQLLNVTEPIILMRTPTSNYTNAAGYSATIYNDTIVITSPNNKDTYTFTSKTLTTSTTLNTLPSTTYSTPYDNYNHYTGTYSVNTYYGPHGSTAQLISGPNGTQLLQINGSTYNSISTNTYIGPNGRIATIVNDIIQVQTSSGIVTYTIKNTQHINGSSSLPPGILESQIPPGEEDLYILKSQIIPPIYPPSCNVIPRYTSSTNNTNTNSSNPSNTNSSTNSSNTNNTNNTNSSNPSTNSKLYPSTNNSNLSNSYNNNSSNLSNSYNNNSSNNSNYSAPINYKTNSNYSTLNTDLLPQPVLSDFSSFGM
jgi:hypothetical protein